MSEIPEWAEYEARKSLEGLRLGFDNEAGPGKLIAAVAAALIAVAAAAEKRGKEEAAKIADEWLRAYGATGDELKHTSPQEWANAAVKDIAAAIRGS